MIVYVILETRRGETEVESVWPNIESAREYVYLIIRTKPRSELWGAFGLDLTWTDGIDEIRIVKREVRTPNTLTLPEGWTENKCQKCGTTIGFGLPETHIEHCDNCAEVDDELDEPKGKVDSGEGDH